MISIFFMHRGAFIAHTGEGLSVAGNQAIWDRFRALTKDLQMPGRARQLPDSYEELCAYYEKMAVEKLKHTASLDIVMDATLRPRRPEYMPVVTAPLWRLLGPIGGHVVAVLGSVWFRDVNPSGSLLRRPWKLNRVDALLSAHVYVATACPTAPARIRFYRPNGSRCYGAPAPAGAITAGYVGSNISYEPGRSAEPLNLLAAWRFAETLLAMPQ